MKKTTIEFIFPIVVEYETVMDLREAIKSVKETGFGQVSTGSTNYEYNAKRPRLLYDKGRLNL